MNHASSFPKPSAIASPERGVLELKASSLGRQNIGSVVEFEIDDTKYTGRLAMVVREGGFTELTLDGQSDEDIVLTPGHKVLVSQDAVAVRGFAIADRGNRVSGEILNVLQMLTRDLAKVMAPIETHPPVVNITNHRPALAAA